MDQEVERISGEKKYTESDMLSAFRHGRSYEPYESDCDVNPKSLPEKNRAFWEWLRLWEETK